jgi:hypothetical protein
MYDRGTVPKTSRVKSPGGFEGKHVVSRPEGVLYAPFLPLCVKYFTEGAMHPSSNFPCGSDQSAASVEYAKRNQ